MTYMSSNIIRKQHTGQAGNGGEFGNHNRTEASIILSGTDPDQEYSIRPGFGPGISIIVNDQIAPPVDEEDIDGVAYDHTQGHGGGFIHTAARARAIAAMFDQSTATADARNLTQSEKRMTLLTTGPMGGAVVREGRGFVTGGGEYDQAALLSKGSRRKGVHLRKLEILAAVEGYGKGEEMLDLYSAAAAKVPAVDEARFDDIPEWSGEGEAPREIAAMYLMDSIDYGQGSAAGCLFAVTSYDPEAYKVDGYFWAPDGSPDAAEQKREYRGNLKNYSGRVRGYRAGTHTISDLKDGVLGTTRAEAYSAVKAASN